jgi:hypothetical protein
LKTIYESYLELTEKVTNLEDEIYKEEFYELFNSLLYVNIKNPELLFSDLKNLTSYKDKVDYLKNIILSKKQDLNYYDKISLDYLEKIRNM